MKYVVTSDIHLGHRKTPTSHIIQSFKDCILNQQNSDSDVLFIAGDLFDRLLDFNSIEVREIIVFIDHLLEYCYKNNILLRILYGTPSHEVNQVDIIVKMNNLREHPCQLSYFEVLDIEYIERIDKWVLYIPDEWTNCHDDLERQINDKLIANGIDRVDIAILHGQFYYQLPIPNYQGFYFREEYFLELVTGYIHIGHYHIHTELGRIIANGSLERLSHGEEEPKGYVVVNNDTYRFVENPNAYTYTTIRVTAKTTYKSLDKRIEALPKNSYIRLRMRPDHPFSLNFQEVRSRYLDHDVRKLVRDDETEKDAVTNIYTDVALEDYGGYVMEQNVHQALMDTITQKHNLTTTELSQLKDHIAPLMKINAEVGEING